MMEKTLLPMNLQFFADEDGADTPENAPESPENESKEPNVEELLAKLAEAEARAKKAESDSTRFKSSIDKLTKEIADKKREDRAKLSEEERRKAEEAEELAKFREKAEADAKELNHLKAVAAYKTIEDSDTVDKLIEAVADSDHMAIADIISNEVSKAVKSAEAEWKKSRPQPTVGDGNFPTKTKEEILAIQDPTERQRMIAQNLELFT